MVAQFTVEGTNDGPLGSMKLTVAKCLCPSAKSATSTSKGESCRPVATTTNTHSSLSSDTSNRPPWQRKPGSTGHSSLTPRGALERAFSRLPESGSEPQER